MQKRKDRLTCKSNLRRETMKRATIFLLAICIGVFSLTGCGISSHKKHEQGSVICIRTGKWSVCCTGSSISKMLSSWVSLASRRSCAFFWGMTATGSHGIRNRWRYAQDDKVFCYLAASHRWQCGPQVDQPMRHERWVDILPLDQRRVAADNA